MLNVDRGTHDYCCGRRDERLCRKTTDIGVCPIYTLWKSAMIEIVSILSSPGHQIRYVKIFAGHHVPLVLYTLSPEGSSS